MQKPEYTAVNSISLEQRFWSKVDIKNQNECWVWKASARNKKGYGMFGIGKNKPALAHRVAYELSYGTHPGDKFVCHKCDNPPCCNPNHLFLGTPKDNIQDMDSKGRRRWSSKTGEANPKAKLTDEKVQEIRQLYFSGEYSYAQLGQLFGISSANVCDILKRKRWGHLPSNIPEVEKGKSLKERAHLKPYCGRGHKYTEANTYYRSDNGHRQCKTCRQERDFNRSLRGN